MSFKDCNRAVLRTVVQYGALRHTHFIVTGPIITITRICTVEGSILITCSEPDAKQIVLTSYEPNLLCRP